MPSGVNLLCQGSKPLMTDQREHVELVPEEGSWKARTWFAGQIIRDQLTIQTPHSSLPLVLKEIKSGICIRAIVKDGSLFFVPGGLLGGNKLMLSIDLFTEIVGVKETIEKIIDEWDEELDAEKLSPKKPSSIDPIHELVNILKPLGRYEDLIEELGKTAKEDIRLFALEYMKRTEPNQKYYTRHVLKGKLSQLRSYLKRIKENYSEIESKKNREIENCEALLERMEGLLSSIDERLIEITNVIKFFEKLLEDNELGYTKFKTGMTELDKKAPCDIECKRIYARASAQNEATKKKALDGIALGQKKRMASQKNKQTLLEKMQESRKEIAALRAELRQVSTNYMNEKNATESKIREVNEQLKSL